MKRNYVIAIGVIALVIAGVFALTSAPESSQAQTADGEGYSAPRTADGHPDLQGIWQAVNSAAWNVEDHSAELGIPAGHGVVEGGEIPYLPAALEKRRENLQNRATADPESKCWMVGVPRTMYMGFPFQVLQTPKEIVMVSEYAHSTRHLRFDSPHPEGPIEWFLGDSRARWDGDTLVVDVVHFGPDNWLDRSGNFHSEAMHAVERYTRTGPDHLLYEVTIEDPQVFSRPWKMSMPLYRRAEPNAQLLEYECPAYLEAKKYPGE